MHLARWTVWLLIAIVATIGYFVSQFLSWAGTEFCIGTFVGGALIYWYYGCWRVDDFREGYRRFRPEDREGRYLKDRAIDPRLE